MDKQDIQIMIEDYIKENLTVEIEERQADYTSSTIVTVKLLLDGEIISSDYFDMD